MEVHVLTRNRSERRHNDWRAALHRYTIDLNRCHNASVHHLWYQHLHQYVDGKIHCSCGMCARWEKTNNKSPRKRRIHGNYAPSRNWSHSDRKKLNQLNYVDNEEQEEM